MIYDKFPMVTACGYRDVYKIKNSHFSVNILSLHKYCKHFYEKPYLV